MPERLLFESHVGMKVDLRGLRRLVAEPQGDHREVNAPTQKLHSHGVATMSLET